jgi:hypothetical protein
MSSDEVLGEQKPVDEELEALRQADLLLNIVLLLFCAGAIAVTLQFPVFEKSYTTWPGLLPSLLLISLAAMAVQILVSVHLHQPRFRDLKGLFRRCRTGLRKTEFRRGLVMLGLLCVYACGMLSRLPYLASTSIFTFLSITAFRAAPWWLAALVAIFNSLSLYFIFGKLYQIPLP